MLSFEDRIDREVGCSEFLANLRGEVGRNPKSPDAHSSLANFLKNKGSLDEAIIHYGFAKNYSAGLPSFFFHLGNFAQCLEFLGDYNQAICCLSEVIEKNGKHQIISKDVNDENEKIYGLILHIILLKQLYIAPYPITKRFDRIIQLIKIIVSRRMLELNAIKKQFKSHWAYVLLICSLLPIKSSPELFTKEELHIFCTQKLFSCVKLGQFSEGLVPFPLYHPLCSSATTLSDQFHCTCCKPLFIIGDSHSLSVAWQRLWFQENARVIVPKLVSGLKAWHVQAGTCFFTHSSLLNTLKNLPPGTSEALFVCGEIDCREGIGGAFDKGKYGDMGAAVRETVNRYIHSLKSLSRQFNVKFYVLPVPPQVRKRNKGRYEQRDRRKFTIRTFNQLLKKSLKLPSLKRAKSLFSQNTKNEDAIASDNHAQTSFIESSCFSFEETASSVDDCEHNEQFDPDNFSFEKDCNQILKNGEFHHSGTHLHRMKGNKEESLILTKSSIDVLQLESKKNPDSFECCNEPDLTVPPECSGSSGNRFESVQSLDITKIECKDSNIFSEQNTSKIFFNQPIMFLDYFDELCGEDGFLLPQYNADGTHMNSAFLPLLERELEHLLGTTYNENHAL